MLLLEAIHENIVYSKMNDFLEAVSQVDQK